MDSPSIAAPPSAFRSWRVTTGLFLALAVYGAVLAYHMGAYAGSSDSSGYLNNARLLKAGHLHVPQRTVEGLPPSAMPGFSYIPLGFVPFGSVDMVPTYPIGLSLLVLATSTVTTWAAAPHVTILLHALAGIVLMYGLARAFGQSRGAAVLGALLLGASPLYLFCGLQALSDVPALVWVTTAIYLAWLSRRYPAWALLAGAAMAVAVLVRPTNLLAVAPLAVCLGFSARRWLFLVLGGLPGAVFLGVFNFRVYGEVLTTGYGDVSRAFGLKFVPMVWTNAAVWLPMLLTPAVILVAALPFVRHRVPRPLPLLLGSWIIAFTGFYSFYFHTSETWWYLRFFLPAFPAMILTMLVVGRALAESWPARTRSIALQVATAATGLWGFGCAIKQSTFNIGRGERVYHEAAQWAQAHLPPTAVVACMQLSGAIYYYSDLTLLRYDLQGDAAARARLDQGCAAAARPIYAALYPWEIPLALEQALPGHWTQVGAVRRITFWRRDGPEPTPVEPELWREFTTDRTLGREIVAEISTGWHSVEKDLLHHWIWSSGRGRFKLETWPRQDGAIELSLALRTPVPATLTAQQDGRVLWSGAVVPDRTPVTFTVPVRDGAAEFVITSDQPSVRENAAPDGRLLAFAVYDLELRWRE